MKIPDNVFETRCRYCVHGRPEGGNKDVRPEWVYQHIHRMDMSCNIFGISRCSEIPGECLSFSPHMIFGICYTCKYNNSFCEGFCTRADQPNKRKLFIGNSGLGGAAKPEYWKDHVLSTCDAYRASPYWINTMRKQAAEGKIPRNFDPETMKPVGSAMSNETAERWATIVRERVKEAEAEKAKKQAEQMAQFEQLSLFTLAEKE